MTPAPTPKPCCCAVYKFPKDRGAARLLYCPLHAAAPALRAALEHLLDCHHERCDGKPGESCPHPNTARAALAQAKGETQ